MNTRAHKLNVTAFLSVCFTALLAMEAAAQVGFPNAVPPPPEGCRVWEAHINYVIEQHKRNGTSEAALGEALSIAYAAYGRCVMCATDQEMNATVAALNAIEGVLSRSRDIASAAPRITGTR